MDANIHLKMNPICRSDGHSSLKAVAYQSGDRIRDEKTEEVYDYSRKENVITDATIAPDGSRLNREAYWNSHEEHLKHPRATVGYRTVTMLPRELSAENQEALAMDFAEAISKQYGVVVDVAIHNSVKGDNPHAHFTIGSCSYENGILGKKVNELDPIHCQHKKIENSAQVLRPTWANLTNFYLGLEGHEKRVDDRSYKRRGIDKTPMVHEGKGYGAAGRKAYNNTIRKLNAERVQNREEKQTPEKVLASLMQKARTGTIEDVRKAQAYLGQLRKELETQIRPIVEKDMKAQAEAARKEREKHEAEEKRFQKMLEEARKKEPWRWPERMSEDGRPGAKPTFDPFGKWAKQKQAWDDYWKAREWMTKNKEAQERAAYQERNNSTPEYVDSRTRTEAAQVLEQRHKANALDSELSRLVRERDPSRTPEPSRGVER